MEQVDQQPTIDGDPNLAGAGEAEHTDDDLIGAQTTTAADGKKFVSVPLETIIGLRKGNRELTRKVKDLEPQAARAKEVDERLEQAAPENQIYLGETTWRLARDAGDRATASAELRRAVELEPKNYLAHRELAGFLLATGQAELARSFYQRAIELNPDDKTSMGFMACALHRLGRTDLAVRFFQRAGAGPWDACKATPPGPLGVPPAAMPGAMPGALPGGVAAPAGAPPR